MSPRAAASTRSASERGAGLLHVALRALPLRVGALFGALGLAQRRFRLGDTSPLLLLALAVRGFRLWPPRCRGSRREQRPKARRLELVLEPPFQHLSGRVLVGGRGLQRVAD